MTDDEVDQLVAGYEAGQSLPELANNCGIHHRTVAAHLEQRGVPRRANLRKLSETDVADAARRYTAGDSLAAVSKHHGVNAETVRRALIRAGVAIRPRFGS